MMQWLKQARKKSGFTQTQIAELCGISQTHYGAIETGIRKPSVKVAKKLGTVLSLKWTRFFD